MADQLIRQIEFKIPHRSDFKEKVLAYFDLPGFELIDQSENRFEFKNKSFFFNTWTFNPLDWASEIVVAKSERKITANFKLNIVGQLYTNAEMEVWNSFIRNFELYLTTGVEYKEDLMQKVKDSKLSGWKLVGIILLIGVLLIPLGVYLNDRYGISLILYFLVPILVGYYINHQRIKSRINEG